MSADADYTTASIILVLIVTTAAIACLIAGIRHMRRQLASPDPIPGVGRDDDLTGSFPIDSEIADRLDREVLYGSGTGRPQGIVTDREGVPVPVVAVSGRDSIPGLDPSERERLIIGRDAVLADDPTVDRLVETVTVGKDSETWRWIETGDVHDITDGRGTVIGKVPEYRLVRTDDRIHSRAHAEAIARHRLARYDQLVDNPTRRDRPRMEAIATTVILAAADDTVTLDTNGQYTINRSGLNPDNITGILATPQQGCSSIRAKRTGPTQFTLTCWTHDGTPAANAQVEICWAVLGVA